MNSSPVITLWSLHSRPCCLHPKVDQHCFHQISCVMIHKILPSFKTHYRQQHVRPNYRENTTITASAVFHWGCHFPDQKSKYQRPVFHNVPVPPSPAARVLMPSTFFCFGSYYSRLHFCSSIPPFAPLSLSSFSGCPIRIVVVSCGLASYLLIFCYAIIVPNYYDLSYGNGRGRSGGCCCEFGLVCPFFMWRCLLMLLFFVFCFCFSLCVCV